jgi:WD40 repeat protein
VVKEISPITDYEIRMTTRSVALVDEVAFDSTGRLIATVDREEAVARIWDAETGELLWRFAQEDIRWIAWHPSAPVLVTMGLSGVIKIWDASYGNLTREIDTGACMGPLLISPKESLIVVLCGGATLSAWSLESGELVGIVDTLGDWYWQGSFSSDGATLYLQTPDHAEIWRVEQRDQDLEREPKSRRPSF